MESRNKKGALLKVISVMVVAIMLVAAMSVSADNNGSRRGFLLIGISALYEGSEDLKGGVSQLLEGNEAMAEGLGFLGEALDDQVAGGLTEMKEAVDRELVPGMDMIVEAVGDQVIPGLQEMKDAIDGDVVPGLDTVLAGFNNDLLPGFTDMKEGIDQEMVPGLYTMIDGIAGDMVPGMHQMKDGIDDIMVPGLNTIVDGITTQMVPGMREMKGGIDEVMVPGLNQMVGGITMLMVPGMSDMKDGIDDIMVPGLDAMIEGITTQMVPIMHTMKTGIDDDIVPGLKEAEIVLSAMRDDLNNSEPASLSNNGLGAMNNGMVNGGLVVEDMDLQIAKIVDPVLGQLSTTQTKLNGLTETQNMVIRQVDGLYNELNALEKVIETSATLSPAEKATMHQYISNAKLSKNSIGTNLDTVKSGLANNANTMTDTEAMVGMLNNYINDSILSGLTQVNNGLSSEPDYDLQAMNTRLDEEMVSGLDDVIKDVVKFRNALVGNSMFIGMILGSIGDEETEDTMLKGLIDMRDALGGQFGPGIGMMLGTIGDEQTDGTMVKGLTDMKEALDTQFSPGIGEMLTSIGDKQTDETMVQGLSAMRDALAGDFSPGIGEMLGAIGNTYTDDTLLYGLNAIRDALETQFSPGISEMNTAFTRTQATHGEMGVLEGLTLIRTGLNDEMSAGLGDSIQAALEDGGLLWGLNALRAGISSGDDSDPGLSEGLGLAVSGIRGDVLDGVTELRSGITGQVIPGLQEMETGIGESLLPGFSQVSMLLLVIWLVTLLIGVIIAFFVGRSSSKKSHSASA